MTFRVGQKVVCIKGGLISINGFVPITGGVYTVRDYFLGQYDKQPRILLEEYIHPEKYLGIEIGWDASRFRPIVKPKSEVRFTQGADPSTDQFDNRRKVRKKVLL